VLYTLAQHSAISNHHHFNIHALVLQIFSISPLFDTSDRSRTYTLSLLLFIANFQGQHKPKRRREGDIGILRFTNPANMGRASSDFCTLHTQRTSATTV
jgi:hypothetical protein